MVNINKDDVSIVQDGLNFETAVCDVCKNAESILVFSGPDRLTGMPGQFQIVECTTCGTLRQNPRLPWNQLKGYYPDEDYSAYQPANESNESAWRKKISSHGVRKRLKAVEKAQPGGRMLDIGCGTGTFLAEAKQTGNWQVEGIEPNEFAANFVKNELDIPVHISTFPEITLPPETYDAITMWNVLEHVYEPIRVLEYAYELLKPNGWLIFSLPNVECLEAKYAKQYWVGWDLPRHLYLYPQVRMQQMLQDTGYHYSHARCLSTSYDSIRYTLTFWAQDESRQDAKWPKTVVKLYHNPIARVALTPLLWSLDQLRLSSIITIFAQKPSQP